MKQPTIELRRDFSLRAPTELDGTAVHDLLEECREAELESAGHIAAALVNFAGTSVLAISPDGRPVGFVVGYPLPASPRRYFVDRVVVRPADRRQGLALRMLLWVLRLPGCAGVRYVEGIARTPGGSSSPARALWAALARELESCVAAVPFSVGAAADPPWERLHLGPFVVRVRPPPPRLSRPA